MCVWMTDKIMSWAHKGRGSCGAARNLATRLVFTGYMQQQQHTQRFADWRCVKAVVCSLHVQAAAMKAPA